MPASGEMMRETVAGRTVTLHQLKNQFKDIRDTTYMYEVRLDGDPVGDPVFTRPDGEAEFDATVRGLEGPRDRDRGGGMGGMGGGLFGGGGGGGLFGGGF